MDTGGYWSDNEPDPYERMEKMVTSIVLGTDMEESGLVRNDDERAIWRKLARGVAAIQREGLMVVYSIRDDEDSA